MRKNVQKMNLSTYSHFVTVNNEFPIVFQRCSRPFRRVIRAPRGTEIMGIPPDMLCLSALIKSQACSSAVCMALRSTIFHPDPGLPHLPDW